MLFEIFVSIFQYFQTFMVNQLLKCFNKNAYIEFITRRKQRNIKLHMYIFIILFIYLSDKNVHFQPTLKKILFQYTS